MSGRQPQWCVYVIGVPDGPQKVGIATDARRRLRLLQTGSPHRLTLARSLPVGGEGEARAVERGAHRILGPRAMTGEWFAVSADEAIAAVDRALEERRSPPPAGVPAASINPVSPLRLRVARALIGWTQGKLAETAGLSLAVVNNVERNVTDPRRSTLEAIQRALESAGIEFIAERQNSPDGGEGVRMRRG